MQARIQSIRNGHRSSRSQLRFVRTMMRVLGITSSCGLAAAALAACSNVHFVGPADTSTADRPSAYRPATLGPDGFFHGTHFRFTLPADWQKDYLLQEPERRSINQATFGQQSQSGNHSHSRRFTHSRPAHTGLRRHSLSPGPQPVDLITAISERALEGVDRQHPRRFSI